MLISNPWKFDLHLQPCFYSCLPGMQRLPSTQIVCLRYRELDLGPSHYDMLHYATLMSHQTTWEYLLSKGTYLYLALSSKNKTTLPCSKSRNFFILDVEAPMQHLRYTKHQLHTTSSSNHMNSVPWANNTLANLYLSKTTAPEPSATHSD